MLLKHTCIMLIQVVVGIISFLFSPQIFSFYFFYDKNLKKLFFAIYLFDVLKIFSGYIKTINYKSIYVHIGKKKALIIDVSLFTKMRNKPNYFNAIDVLLYKSVATISLNGFLSIYGALTAQTINNTACKIVSENKKFISLKNNIRLVENFNGFTYVAKTVICFNIAGILFKQIAHMFK